MLNNIFVWLRPVLVLFARLLGTALDCHNFKLSVDGVCKGMLIFSCLLNLDNVDQLFNEIEPNFNDWIFRSYLWIDIINNFGDQLMTFGWCQHVWKFSQIFVLNIQIQNVSLKLFYCIKMRTLLLRLVAESWVDPFAFMQIRMNGWLPQFWIKANSPEKSWFRHNFVRRSISLLVLLNK